MEILIEQNPDNNLFEEVAFYKGMLGEFSYNPREFCITFAMIKDKQTDVLRYIGSDSVIHIPDGVMAVPYLLQEGYDTHKHITIVNHSRHLIDLDYILYHTKIQSVTFEEFDSPVFIQTAESAFEGSDLESIDIATLSLSKCRNMIRMFADTKLTQIDLSGIYLKNDTNLEQIFADCELLQDVKLYNNGAGERLELMMQASFLNCNQLRDLQIYDADIFAIPNYSGDIRTILPENSPLFYSLNCFLTGFVPEFNEKIGVRLNDAFDIKCINEYSMLIRKSTSEDMLNHISFVFKLLQEVRVDEYGNSGEVGQIHFVRSISKEIENRKREGNDSKRVILIQPRQSGDEDVLVYALYLGKGLKGYRIKYKEQYYDVSPTEYVQLGFSGIIPSKKLKLTAYNEEYHVRQRQGEPITIYGYDELAGALEVNEQNETGNYI